MTAESHRSAAWLRTPADVLVLGLLMLILNGLLSAAVAHGVAEGDQGDIEETGELAFVVDRAR